MLNLKLEITVMDSTDTDKVSNVLRSFNKRGIEECGEDGIPIGNYKLHGLERDKAGELLQILATQEYVLRIKYQVAEEMR